MPTDVDAAFYKELWQQTERDRQTADKDLREMACLTLDLLDAMGIDDHPNAELRGAVRKLRYMATERTKGVLR